MHVTPRYGGDASVRGHGGIGHAPSANLAKGLEPGLSSTTPKRAYPDASPQRRQPALPGRHSRGTAAGPARLEPGRARPLRRHRRHRSGYQAAILAHLARKVCTIEIIPPLAEAAAKTLRDLRYDNVSVRLGDGYVGWPECGPFDAIVVTAALGQVPPPLIEQLKVGGAARHAGGGRIRHPTPHGRREDRP